MGLHAEEQAAQGEQHHVDGQVHLSHGDSAAPLGEVQGQNVGAAQTAAAGERQAAAQTADDAAHQTAGEGVVHQRHGGNGDQAEEQGTGGGADNGVAQKDLSQGAVGDQQQGDVQGVVQDAGEIKAQALPVQGHQHQGPDELADAHQAAAVQAHGNDEQIHAQRVDKSARDAEGQTAPSASHGLVQHKIGSFLFPVRGGGEAFPPRQKV